MSMPHSRAWQLARALGPVDTEATIDGVKMSAIADAVSTPFYVYSGEAVLRQARRVVAALGPETDLYFSLKANPSLAIGQLLAAEGVGAEVASAGELVVAQAAGFPPSRTIFAGPGKTRDELERAVRAGIHAVNVESAGEMERLRSVAAGLGATARAAVRVNPAVPLKGAQMRMGGDALQFGVDEEDLPAFLDRFAGDPHVDLVGVHVYAGTQVFDVEALSESCHRTLDLARAIAGRVERPLEMIDFGGGFGVPYFEGMTEFDLDAFAEAYAGVVRRARGDPLLSGARLVVELGRYLVADAGVYVTRVVDVKRSRGRTFVVTDGGMNHHIMATGNFGQVFRRPYPLAVLGRMDAEARDEVSVVGPCCTPLDVLARSVALPPVQVGDLIGVFRSGAYGYSASSLHFLSHPTPAEVLVWHGRVQVLRPAGTPEQVLDGQRALQGEEAAAPANVAQAWSPSTAST